MRSLSAGTVRSIRTASIANLGCKVNQSEMDAVERILRARGVALVDPGEPADLAVVNTCAVTGIADQKSRHAVRRARRLNLHATTLVTGCSVQLDPAAFAGADPDARLLANDSLLGGLAELVGACAGEARGEGAGEGYGPIRIERTRAFVKVQDGCSFHCTYCIVPRARGGPRSVAAGDVVGEVAEAVAAGHREIVVTGINVGTYEGGVSLAGVVRRILAETDVERIRLSSIEPQHVTDELLDVWAASGGRCLPHFHVPLQSGDDGVLRRMGRRYTSAAYEAVLGRIRDRIPGAAIHADVIAGFPGEDEAAWGRTIDLLRRADLAGFHVFRFSARPDTPAARMVGQVDGETKKRRAAEGLALAAEARASFARRQIGRELEVLFESRLAGGWVGHAENYVPVAAAAADGSPLENVLATVRAVSVDDGDDGRVRGTIVSISPATRVRTQRYHSLAGR